MADHEVPSQRVMREEADSAVVGPGVVATKSQIQGSAIGALVGAVIGAVIGLLAGLLIWNDSTQAIMIAVIVFAVGGATAGGTSGGFLRNRERMERGDPDV